MHVHSASDSVQGRGMKHNALSLQLSWPLPCTDSEVQGKDLAPLTVVQTKAGMSQRHIQMS